MLNTRVVDDFVNHDIFEMVKKLTLYFAQVRPKTQQRLFELKFDDFYAYDKMVNQAAYTNRPNS